MANTTFYPNSPNQMGRTRNVVPELAKETGRFRDIRGAYIEIFQQFADLIPLIGTIEVKSQPTTELKALRLKLMELEKDLPDFRKEVWDSVYLKMKGDKQV